MQRSKLLIRYSKLSFKINLIKIHSVTYPNSSKTESDNPGLKVLSIHNANFNYKTVFYYQLATKK